MDSSKITKMAKIRSNQPVWFGWDPTFAPQGHEGNSNGTGLPPAETLDTGLPQIKPVQITHKTVIHKLQTLQVAVIVPEAIGLWQSFLSLSAAVRTTPVHVCCVGPCLHALTL